jgi:hypothetical protein
MTKKLNIFIPIHKIDEERRMVYGIATAEQPDKSGEICDYESTVPYYKAWSEEIEKASNGKSKGNLRVMHGDIVAGTIPQISFNDTEKQIEICGKVIDDAEWKKVMAGAYTGFSQGGKYIKTWKDGEFTRYTANPCEISLVDNPCLSSATFEVLKADGGIELRKFQILEQNKMAKKEEVASEVTQGWKAKDGSFHVSKAAAIAHNEELVKKAEEQIDEKNDNQENQEAGENREATKAEAVEADQEKDAVAKADGDVKAALKKGMWGVSQLASILSAIQDLQTCAEWEAKDEGDGSAMPSELKDWLKRGGELLAAMALEEAKELTGEKEEPQVMQMSADGDLEKAGAKISKATKEQIMKMHKSASDHMGTMEECMKAMGAMEDDGDAEKAVKDSLDKAAEIEKNFEDKITPELEKVSGLVDALQKRIALLEAQPAEPKGATRVVLKDNENHGGEAGKSSPVEALLKRTDLSPEAMAKEYAKLILQK